MDLGMLGYGFLGPRGPGSDASPSEQVAAFVAQLLFPGVLFCLVAFAGLGHNETAAWLVTALLSLAGYVIARVLSESLSFALWTAIAGALWNLVGAGAGFLVGGLIEFLGTF